MELAEGSTVSHAVLTGLVACFLSLEDLSDWFRRQKRTLNAIISYIKMMSYKEIWGRWIIKFLLYLPPLRPGYVNHKFSISKNTTHLSASWNKVPNWTLRSTYLKSDTHPASRRRRFGSWIWGKRKFVYIDYLVICTEYGYRYVTVLYWTAGLIHQLCIRTNGKYNTQMMRQYNTDTDTKLMFCIITYWLFRAEPSLTDGFVSFRSRNPLNHSQWLALLE